MKAVMLSIHPKWCEKIANGKKTVEVRKSKPKLETPFKCYIYCTKDKYGHLYVNRTGNLREEFPMIYIKHNATSLVPKGYINGMVIGEFICDHIIKIHVGKYGLIPISIDGIDLSNSMLSPQEIICYIGNGENGYGWHISNLKIYDKPKELIEFTGLRKTKFGLEPVSLVRPPQSWCYVEDGVFNA